MLEPMPKKNQQPDDPGRTIEDLCVLQIESEQKYKTRWNIYHMFLTIGVWGIWACTLVAVFQGWGPR